MTDEKLFYQYLFLKRSVKFISQRYKISIPQIWKSMLTYAEKLPKSEYDRFLSKYPRQMTTLFTYGPTESMLTRWEEDSEKKRKKAVMDEAIHAWEVKQAFRQAESLRGIQQ